MFIDTCGLSRELSNVRKRVLAQRCWEWGWVALCFLVVCEGKQAILRGCIESIDVLSSYKYGAKGVCFLGRSPLFAVFYIWIS